MRFPVGRSILALAVALALEGCGASSNLLGLTVPAEHRRTFDAELDQAQAGYDRGDLDEALRHARRAHEIDPDAEDPSILLGFVSLSKARGDPFSIAIALSSAKAAPNDAESATSGPLGILKGVLGLKESELASMGTLDRSDPALPLVVPSCAEDARRDVERIAFLNEAIVAVCPFVPVSARVLDDQRQRCGPTDRPIRSTEKALFLWAFAHLTEALAFNAVLTYGTADPTGKKSNLELRVEGINAKQTGDPTQLADFLAAVSTLEKTLGAVMPTSGACSPTAPTTQLVAALNDLLAVDLAFSALPNVPKKVTASIKAAVAKIKELQAKVATVPGASSSQALKADLNQKIAKNLGAKLDKIAAEQADQITPEQKTQVCAAYQSISGGISTPPALCAGL